MSSPGGPWTPPAPPPPDGDAEKRPAPQEVREAWSLWLAAAGFALLGMLLNAATARFGDLPTPTRDALRDAVDAAGETGVTVEAVFSMALALGAVLALLAAAVTVWLAFRLRAGKGWARTLLTVVAVFLVVDAVSVVVGVFGGVAMAGERDDVISFIVFAFQILAGLCAATAVWRQHSAPAVEFTRRDGGGAGDR